MSEDHWTALILGAILVALINSIRAAHWKARCQAIEQERNNDGWQNEALFLRRIVNQEAAEAVEDQA